MRHPRHLHFSTAHRLAIATLAIVLSLAGSPAFADDGPQNPVWAALRDDSLRALSSLGYGRPDTSDDTSDLAAEMPRMIVVGFTGGLEGRDSRVSGVAQMRRRIEAQIGAESRVRALTFNNREWRAAADSVLGLLGADDIARGAGARPTSMPPPLIVVFGHSWGGGAVTQFARALGKNGIDVALAVYIDAFALRNPRVPGNVRYAVNMYQRSGIFRGFPLRGKSRLILESPESTVLLANLRISPDTDHFGWHWNIVQPLLYRHHHRMGHDLRLQQYLLDLVSADPPAAY